MTCILHLIDPGSRSTGPCTLRLLADLIQSLPDLDHLPVVIGSVHDVELALRCGLKPKGWLCPPVSLPFAGHRDLRRLLNHLSTSERRVDLIHAWSIRCAVLSTLAWPGRPRLATLQVAPPKNFASRYQSRVLARDPVPLLTASSAVARQCRAAGFLSQHVALMPPAVNSRIGMVDRAEARALWVDSDVDDSTFVVGLLSEPIHWPNVRAVATSVGRVALSGRNVRLIAHPDAAKRIEAERFLSRLPMRQLMIFDEKIAAPWQLVTGLDAAILPAPRSGQVCGSMLPLLWALAAGVPVIAERNGLAHDVIDHSLNGVLIDPHDVNAASAWIVRWYDDRRLGRHLGESAAALVADTYDISSFALRLNHAYELLLTGGAANLPRAHRAKAQAEMAWSR
jgi:hypothetical protein